jgi:hypothetical protein
MPRVSGQAWIGACPGASGYNREERPVARSITLLAGAAVFAAALGGPAFSQGAPQTLSLMKVDPQSVATGYRTSKVVGSAVINEANETVGTIDDLIVTPNEKVPLRGAVGPRLPRHGHEIHRGAFQRASGERQADDAPWRNQRFAEKRDHQLTNRWDQQS